MYKTTAASMWPSAQAHIWKGERAQVGSVLNGLFSSWARFGSTPKRADADDKQNEGAFPTHKKQGLSHIIYSPPKAEHKNVCSYFTFGSLHPKRA